jgi:phosphomannomutase
VLDALVEMAPIDAIKARKFTVAIDSVNASGRMGARLLMDALGCELVHLHTEETGDFPHAPEPTRENLSGAGGLADAVREHGCAIGFAQDPDADRLAIIDEAGAYIGEEYTLALAAWAILSSTSSVGGATLAANLSTSRLIDDVAGQYGANVLRTAVGEANVAQTLDEHAGLFGGEGNGGVIWPDVVMIRDSLTAMALTLALMTRTGKTVSQLADSLGAYSIIKEKSPIEPGAAADAVEAVASRWKTARVNRLDGVRIDLDDQRAWLHVRPSNTEPILRLIAEAPDEHTARRLIDEARQEIASSQS